MNFGLTGEQRDMLHHVRTLLDDVCSMDYAAQCDERHTPPREAFEALARNGWLGLIAPEVYGGGGRVGHRPGTAARRNRQPLRGTGSLAVPQLSPTAATAC